MKDGLFCILVLKDGSYREIYSTAEPRCWVYTSASGNAYTHSVSKAREILAKDPTAYIDPHRSRHLRFCCDGNWFDTFEDIVAFFVQLMRYTVTEVLF